MTSQQKFDAIIQCNNFGVDFKNVIGMARAIQGKVEAATYFKGTKKEFS